MASQIQNLLERTLGDGARSTNFEVFFNMGSDTILNDKNILIKSTALPTRSHQIIDFKYRGKSIPLRGQTKYSQTWECTFYITERHDVRIALEKIMDSLDNMNDYKDNKNKILNTYHNNVIIFQKDHNDDEAVMYMLYNVFPIEIGAISYDSSQVGVIAEMSVTFAYSYYEVTDIKAEKKGNAIDDFMKKITTPLNEFKPADLYGDKGLIAATGASIAKIKFEAPPQESNELESPYTYSLSEDSDSEEEYNGLLFDGPSTNKYDQKLDPSINSNTPVNRSYNSGSEYQGLPTQVKLG